MIHSNFYTFDDTGIVIAKGLEYWVYTFIQSRVTNWSDVYAQRFQSDAFGFFFDKKAFPIYTGNLFKALLGGLYASCWTLLVKRECLVPEVRFSEQYSTYEDYWFFCHLAEYNDAVFIDIATAENRGHQGPRLTQVDDISKLKHHIDICERIYLPSKSKHRPSTQEIKSQQKKLYIALYKEYLKKGLRSEARQTYSTIRALKIPPRDTIFWLYWLMSLLPFNIVKNLVKLKRVVN